ncbi:tyrosine recombinase XerS [Domibacillus epiphyticus]|uniref:Tyrosine recombinase XerS n=1 Tax=Domibacillus epiphyticus TaxID=1714355 RepID=A0A1V2A5X2_9BACI|nr:tyrosine recombinase XerS [Domibacillus epiphyticus]OMP66262.1 tyrosine recombinase XerS [Domibacillus epiphyticus]
MASPREEQLMNVRIEGLLKEMPFYVVEFVRAKLRAGLSPATLLDYLYDYLNFFHWLRKEGIVHMDDNVSIPFTILAELRKKDIEYYIDHLQGESIEVRAGVWKKRSDARVTRVIQSLKSLFRYLTEETEDETGECYFDRNVMAKIKTIKSKETKRHRARRISSAILNESEISEFINFMKWEYEHTLTPRRKAMYLRNKERDIAIISLMLGSGTRVGEIAGITLMDIDVKKNQIDVNRKGGKTDSIHVLPSSMQDLEVYLAIRKQRYGATDKDVYVFLSKYKGQAQPLSIRAIQNNINEYTSAFTSGKSLSPHKMRHSFATDWLRNGGSLVLLREQLGHSSIETTSLYTNLSDTDSQRIMESIDINRTGSDIEE